MQWMCASERTLCCLARLAGAWSRVICTGDLTDDLPHADLAREERLGNGMSVTKLLIANRGEIAIRFARAAADMGIPSVAVYSEDDARSLHLRVADESRMLPGVGAAAYLNGEAVVAAALASGCDAI